MRLISMAAFLAAASLLPFVLTACGGDPKLTGTQTADADNQGTTTTLSLNATQANEKASIDAQLATVQGLTSDTLISGYSAPQGALGYDPSQAIGLDVIQQSSLGLNDAELQAYQTNGFVISSRQQFPTFTYGYASIYSSHLPLFVSADSMMYPVHRSFDSILENLESNALIQELDTLLTATSAVPPGPSTRSSHSGIAPDAAFLSIAKRKAYAGICRAGSPTPPDFSRPGHAPGLFVGSVVYP